MAQRIEVEVSRRRAHTRSRAPEQVTQFDPLAFERRLEFGRRLPTRERCNYHGRVSRIAIALLVTSSACGRIGFDAFDGAPRTATLELLAGQLGGAGLADGIASEARFYFPDG